MQCPVCAAQAKNLTPATYDGVVVGCPRCGDYQITGTIFDKLLRLGAEESWLHNFGSYRRFLVTARWIRRRRFGLEWLPA